MGHFIGIFFFKKKKMGRKYDNRLDLYSLWVVDT